MKPAIAFVTGGYSSESVISYKSAVTIENNLDTEKYDVYRIDLTPDGWFHQTKAGEKINVDKSDFSLQIAGKKILFDAALIGIHGTPGEDGRLQGYLDLLNIPYNTCDTASSAITFNKRYSVAVAGFAGVNVARSVHIFKSHPLSAEEVLQQLSLPVFVKPNNGGSSIGMSKVNKAEELAGALLKAFAEDDQVLVEEFIQGREFTVGVIRTTKELLVLPITEVRSKNEFFDFEAKYQGLNEETTPAQISDVMADKVRSTARKIYDALNCRGVVRMDFIYNEAKDAPFFLEVNTIPGQSEASIVPQQVRAMGWTLKGLYTEMIEDALSRKKSS
ncbi:D-alanine--D-alanine ligase [Pseudobacter ginsenosidimutans]|uniref:D-alanine--D-alanine ligase n=1 Tax=Pseudobacter ginsenosidimutans TaxID=661488 RepID=A0A4Q7MB89_9BACT|nr:D-alanine--D-alanine ligase [Pseudobacter ginsenosidimutans]QEC42645.1 D-alanine--D-alanine ligase [Pseudobacter ginsenosidimutans]RZS65204.1 D-alanine-D-alanine ligase [Pseudobacter ginsenosidimutans]